MYTLIYIYIVLSLSLDIWKVTELGLDHANDSSLYRHNDPTRDIHTDGMCSCDTLGAKAVGTVTGTKGGMQSNAVKQERLNNTHLKSSFSASSNITAPAPDMPGFPLLPPSNQSVVDPGGGGPGSSRARVWSLTYAAASFSDLNFLNSAPEKPCVYRIVAAMTS